MFRLIVSIVTSAVLLGLAVVSCLNMDLSNAKPTDWLWFSIYAIIGIVALVRLAALAKEFERQKKEKSDKTDAAE